MRICAVNFSSGTNPGLAEVALAFGATVAFDASGIVWVDVTGCAHLHAPDQHEGEKILASRLAAAYATLGHTCNLAIADGPRVAAILARALPLNSRVPNGIFVVPSGKNAEALAPLPVTSLPLDADDARWLTKIGVRTIAELLALPRSSLATRLGASARVVCALAEGDDRAPLTPWIPPEVPEEEATLEYGIEGGDALTFVTKALADRIGARLAGRAASASRLELELTLDAGVLPAGADRRELVAMDLPAPLYAPSDLLAALRPKIERLVLRAPVLGAKLRAPTLVPRREAALSLFEPRPKAERALPRLVAELASDLGEDAVGKLALGDAWAPEDRSPFVKFEVQTRLPLGKKKRHMVSSVPEPTRILAEPEIVPRQSLHVVRHLARLEHVAWWKKTLRADFVYAWIEDGGAAWVEIDRVTGTARIRGWFD